MKGRVLPFESGKENPAERSMEMYYTRVRSAGKRCIVATVYIMISIHDQMSRDCAVKQASIAAIQGFTCAVARAVLLV